jgi:hypothetical protein
MRNSLKLAAVLVAVTAGSASAQGRGRNTDGVPPGQRPPSGMCRVWINGVPPGQQPGVTDCATALAQVPANGRVLYGSGTTSMTTNRVYTRRRQLSDGSWVLDRFRRDAAGNVTLVSTNPLNTSNAQNKVLKAQRKAENDQLKAQRKIQKDQLKAERKIDKQESKIDDEQGEKGNRGGKGKGKH